MKKLAGALVLLGAVGAWLWGQTPSKAVIVNPGEAKWTREKNAPADTESIMIRQDAATGGMEIMVRFPAGHVFKPHWHESNERVMVTEGQLAVKLGDRESHVEVGGYAFLPPREMQYLTCTQKSRCTMYLAWDGNPATHSEALPK